MWKCFMNLALSFLVIIGTVDATVPLVIDSLDGPVTHNEIKAFKGFIATAALPTDNIGNAMVYGKSGVTINAMGQMYEVTGDTEILDRMITFADHMLKGRND